MSIGAVKLLGGHGTLLNPLQHLSRTAGVEGEIQRPGCAQAECIQALFQRTQHPMAAGPVIWLDMLMMTILDWGDR